MGRKVLKLVGLVILTLVWVVVILALATQFWDPWKLGLKDADYDMVNALNCLNEACDLWALPGNAVIPVGNTRITTDAQGHRVVPGSHPTGIPLIFLGDSNVMGYLVNDDETFAHFFAQDNPKFAVENWGVWGYGINHYAQIIATQPPTAPIVVFLTDNDVRVNFAPVESIRQDDNTPPGIGLNLIRYAEVLWWTIKPEGTPLEELSEAEEREAAQWFAEQAKLIQDRVLFIGFSGDLPAEILAEQGADVCTIEMYPRSTYIGPFDGHPNPEGHAWIAAEITANCLPQIEALTDRIP